MVAPLSLSPPPRRRAASLPRRPALPPPLAVAPQPTPGYQSTCRRHVPVACACPRAMGSLKDSQQHAHPHHPRAKPEPAARSTGLRDAAPTATKKDAADARRNRRQNAHFTLSSTTLQLENRQQDGARHHQ